MSVDGMGRIFLEDQFHDGLTNQNESSSSGIGFQIPNQQLSSLWSCDTARPTYYYCHYLLLRWALCNASNFKLQFYQLPDKHFEELTKHALEKI